MAYGDFKDLTRRTTYDKLLRNISFNIDKILNIMDINEVLLQWSIHFLIKKFWQWYQKSEYVRPAINRRITQTND